MREIKFRAWDVCHHRIITWEDLQYTTPIGWIDKIIPMQFTGLKDKNGKEIYEGDILKETEGGAEKFLEVYWDELIPNFSCKNGNYHTPICESYSEVVGNIYENPELLK